MKKIKIKRIFEIPKSIACKDPLVSIPTGNPSQLYLVFRECMLTVEYICGFKDPIETKIFIEEKYKTNDGWEYYYLGPMDLVE